MLGVGQIWEVGQLLKVQYWVLLLHCQDSGKKVMNLCKAILKGSNLDFLRFSELRQNGSFGREKSAGYETRTYGGVRGAAH